MLAAVIFDFDGVIVDSESPEFEAWAEIYRRHDCRLEIAEWAAGIGTRGGFDPYAALVARARRPVPEEAQVRRAKRLLAGPLLDRARALPGVTEWLSECRLAGVPVGIASSSLPSAIARHLNRLELDREFACVSCCDGTLRPKPHPDTYLVACERLGAEPARSLAV
ncbi:MAG: HAD family hydrolase, partial [Actinomycetota bacterium]